MSILRNEKKVSRRRLAKILDISVSTLIFIESGWKKDIDYEILNRICRYFHVELSKMIHSDCNQQKSSRR